MKQILLVEDDPEITRLLTLHLNTAKYNLVCCANGQEATEKVNAGKPDLIILDITLPDTNGLELCKRIRSNDEYTPIIMLTCRSEESDKVLALELGADDYMTKPFGILELIARTKALLRRAGRNANDETANGQQLACKDLRIDTHKKKALLRGERLELTPKEFDLLTLLAANPGKTFSRHELLEQVWGVAFAGYEHTITSHINRLRIKLETNLHQPEYILTSWGTGYRFAE